MIVANGRRLFDDEDDVEHGSSIEDAELAPGGEARADPPAAPVLVPEARPAVARARLPARPVASGSARHSSQAAIVHPARAARPSLEPAPRRPWFELRARWKAGHVALALAALLAIAAALRPLASPLGSPRVRLLYVLGLGLGVAGSALLASLKGRGQAAHLAFYAFLVLALDGLGQVARVHGWPAWPPMALLIAALAVAEPVGLALGVATLASLLAVADAAAHDYGSWREALAAVLGYGALVLALHQALANEKRRLLQARAELARLQFGVEQVEAGEPAAASPAAQALRELSGEGRRARQADHARELDEALLALVRVARQALRAHSIVYFDLDHERTLAHLRAADGPETLATNCAVPFNQDPIAFVVDRKQSFYATDFKRLLGHLPYYQREQPIGTLLAQPVWLGASVGGVLLADALEIQRFTDDEPALLAAFAASAAGTLVRLRSAFAREELGLEFSAVYEASQGLRTLQTAARVRHVLLASAQNLVPFEAAAVVSTDGEGYEIESALGWASEYEGRQVALGERTWTAWLLRSAQQSTLITDLTRAREHMPTLVLDEGGGRAEALLGFPLRVPLKGREELLGGLVLLGRRGAFDASAQRVLDMLASQAAVALFVFQLIRSHEQRALVDGLTGLYNRRAFDDQLARALAQQDRTNGPLCVLLFDVDHFKKLNDTYGHPAGDAALKSVARSVQRALRRGDIAARYGGEEFVVILPETQADGGERLGERIREALEKATLVFEGASIRFTASFGLAVWPQDGREAEALLSAADRALYAAKQGGRNRVVSASSLPAAEAPSAAPASH